MAWSAPCTLQVQLQNTLNKNIVARWQPVSKTNIIVEFYLYPTVGTVLIHSVKPELTE